MTMKNPPHPGEIIRDLCIKPLGLTVTQSAEGLGVTRKTLSLLLNGHAGISPEMAIRLSQAFGRSPESWLQLQVRYDIAQVKRSSKQIKIKPLYDSNRPQLGTGNAMNTETTPPEDLVSLYRRAFEEFGSRALWNVHELEDPNPRDALVIARYLRVEGNLAARRLAERIEKACHATY
jgi:addiction module HigA family antidote